MPIDSLTGFLTQPDAGRAFNRSQRTLERDLDTALRTGELKVLQHWKLQTKNGEVRDAEEVTIDQIKALQTDGQNPVWYIRESFLEGRYGRKGEAKPRQQPAAPQANAHTAGDTSKPTSTPGDTSDFSHGIASDVEFLRERIRALEREKQEEILRNQKREEKLFDQLAVKDRQISAWDELTQALATGQIKPDVSAMLNGGAKVTKTVDVNVDRTKTATPSPKAKSAIKADTRKKPSKKAVKTRAKDGSAKTNDRPRWYHTPTLGKILARR